MTKSDSTPDSGMTDTAEQLLDLIRAFIQELHPGREDNYRIHLDSSLDRELGLDSLTRVELMARLEKTFQLTLSERLLTTAETPRDFLRELLSSKKSGDTILGRQLEKLTLDSDKIQGAPYTAATLVEVLDWHVARHPDRPHIHFYDDSDTEDILTYQELLEGAQQIAAGLQQLGGNAREAVLIMLPTGREYFFSFFGILLAGGIPVPVYPPGHIKQIEEHLRRHASIADNCLAGIMITMDETVRFAQLMKSQVKSLRHVVTVTDLGNQAHKAAAGAFMKPALTSDDIAFLQYTSGSTGIPKGVVLTHANLLANVRSMGAANKVDSQDVFVSWLPLYHDMGLIGAWLGSLHFACPLVLMSPLTFLARPVRWLRAIHRYGGTLSAAPNFAYELCARRLDDKDMQGIDLSSWRIAFNGAEAISPQTLEQFTAKFAAWGLKRQTMTPVYGLAESSVGLAFPPLGRGPVIDRIDRKIFMESTRAVPVTDDRTDSLAFVNCGRPLPEHEIRVVDDADREMPDRQEGNIQFRGPSATSGYFRNPQKTAELFHGSWLNSGDRGYIADGDLYITGRIKDIVIRAGRNIYPEAIEEAIGKIEGVRPGNVAVFGTSDPATATEKMVVLAESRKRDDAAREEIRKRINQAVNELAGLPPDDVVIARPNTVLKTSSGKIRRAACRELYERGMVDAPHRSVRFQVARFFLSGLRPQLQKTVRSLTASLYAAWCWLLFGFSSLLGIPLAFLPFESWRWHIFQAILKAAFRLAGIRFIIFGTEHLPPQDTPAVFVSNHASYLDSFILLTGLPRIFSFIAKGELGRNFLLRTLLNRIGTEFVERFDKKKSIRDVDRLLDRANAGRSMLFFAEGTFMRMPGLLPFRMGAFETAARGRLPVIPIAVRGSRSILRAGSWFPRRRTVSITIGESIRPEEAGDRQEADNWKRALELRARTRKWILQHCGEPDLEDVRPPLLTGKEPQKKE